MHYKYFSFNSLIMLLWRCEYFIISNVFWRFPKSWTGLRCRTNGSEKGIQSSKKMTIMNYLSTLESNSEWTVNAHIYRWCLFGGYGTNTCDKVFGFIQVGIKLTALLHSIIKISLFQKVKCIGNQTKEFICQTWKQNLELYYKEGLRLPYI